MELPYIVLQTVKSIQLIQMKGCLKVYISKKNIARLLNCHEVTRDNKVSKVTARSARSLQGQSKVSKVSPRLTRSV